MTVKTNTKIKKEYEKAIRSFRYFDAIKLAGVLDYLEDNESREKEAQVYFLMQNYDTCINLFKKRKPETKREWELYISSLACVGNWKEVNHRLKGRSKIDIYCSANLLRLAKSEDVVITTSYNVVPEKDAFFKRLYIKNIVLTLVETYEKLNDAKLISDLGVSPTAIIDEAVNFIKDIGVQDIYVDDILSQILNDGIFDPKLIISFMHIYLGEITSADICFNQIAPFREVDDIVFYLDIVRRVSPKMSELDVLVPYIAVISQEISCGNPVVGNYLKELYVYSHLHSSEIKINDETSVSQLWADILQKQYPHLLDFSKEKISNSNIRIVLSPAAGIAYDAAIWQYEATISDNYGVKDAGMLCLSFIRIIELELNKLVKDNLENHTSVLRELYNEELSKITSKKKSDSFKEKWNRILTPIINGEGLVLGTLWYLFNNLSINRTEDSITMFIRDILKDTALNDKGMTALYNGRFADIINQEVREKYRNPPAHTRYVNKETAFECKTYVENVLQELHSYKK